MNIMEANALVDLQRAATALETAQVEYRKAVMQCYELGLSNVVIAKNVGKTEAAIRAFIKRMLAKQPWRQ